MSMNVAHDLDRAGNDARVVKGDHWIISSNISVGSAENIACVLAGVSWLRMWSGRFGSHDQNHFGIGLDSEHPSPRPQVTSSIPLL